MHKPIILSWPQEDWPWPVRLPPLFRIVNAIYRDLIQALVMVQVDHLVLAVSNIYKYQSGGKAASSSDYKNTCSVAETLYAHTRVKLPYGLTVIGY